MSSDQTSSFPYGGRAQVTNVAHGRIGNLVQMGDHHGDINLTNDFNGSTRGYIASSVQSSSPPEDVSPEVIAKRQALMTECFEFIGAVANADLGKVSRDAEDLTRRILEQE